MQHEMQHPDSPTWCIHCGTFDIYCEAYACTASRAARFDSREQENAQRMFGEFFGLAV